MKKIFLKLALVTVSISSFAQTNTFPTTGNAGIGTTTPATPLYVVGGAPMGGGWNKTATLKATYPVLLFNSNDAKWAGIGYDFGSGLNVWVNGSSDNLQATATTALSISNSGNLTLGSGTAGSKLDITGETNFTKFLNLKSDNQELRFYRADAIYGYLWSSLEGLHWGKGSGNNSITIDNNGNTGIGTTVTKGYKLAVAGNMVAESVTVKLQSTWPDYVFAKDYPLPSLQQTEKHIKEKGHLPGIPSAEEVKASGIDLGEMNAKLLKKIEEMTLIMIQLNKKVEQQAETLKIQQAQLDKLK